MKKFKLLTSIICIFTAFSVNAATITMAKKDC